MGAGEEAGEMHLQVKEGQPCWPRSDAGRGKKKDSSLETSALLTS